MNTLNLIKSIEEIGEISPNKIEALFHIRSYFTTLVQDILDEDEDDEEKEEDLLVKEFRKRKRVFLILLNSLSENPKKLELFLNNINIKSCESTKIIEEELEKVYGIDINNL